MAKTGFGDPGKNDFGHKPESGEPKSEYTGTQSSRKQSANDNGKKTPTLADQTMQVGRQY